MTFAPFRVHGYRCRNKPDSKSRSVRVKKEGALWKSASARRDRASGLGRYLSVESASCGLECRAQEPIKTCRLELTETRTWVSSVSLYHLLQFLKIIYIYIILYFSCCLPLSLCTTTAPMCLFRLKPGLIQICE